MKIRSIIGILTVVLAGFIIFSLDVADARTIYVDDSYMGIGDGSRERPYSTIRAGISSTTPGGSDTIIVRGGTYVENIVMGPGGPSRILNIEIFGELGSQPVILRPADSTQPAIIIGGSYASGRIFAEIKNITIEGGEAENSRAGIMITGFYGEGKIQIHGCNFRDRERGSSIYRLDRAILIENSFGIRSKLLIYNNTFSFSGNAIEMNNSDRRVFSNSRDFPIKIFNNLFYRCSAGVWVWNSNAIIYNNTFQDFYVALACMAETEVGKEIDFFNNIVFKPRMAGIISYLSPRSTVKVRYNDFYTSIADSLIGIPGTSLIRNINSDPLFANLDISDLHLQRGSPCINSGTNLYGLDRDGSPVDMGAYGGPYSLDGAS